MPTTATVAPRILSFSSGMARVLQHRRTWRTLQRAASPLEATHDLGSGFAALWGRRLGANHQLHASSSSQLERGQREQRHDQPGNPETSDDLRLLPANGLEVMVQRGHFENTFAPRFVTAHLQNDRERFDDIHTADEWQQQLLLDQHG